jgi:hypothetical protein
VLAFRYDDALDLDLMLALVWAAIASATGVFVWIFGISTVGCFGIVALEAYGEPGARMPPYCARQSMRMR